MCTDCRGLAHEKSNKSKKFDCFISEINGLKIINALEVFDNNSKKGKYHFFLLNTSVNEISIVEIDDFDYNDNGTQTASYLDVFNYFSNNVTSSTLGILIDEKESFAYNGAKNYFHFVNFAKKSTTTISTTNSNSSNSKVAELLFQKGQELFDNKKYLEAIDMLDSSLEYEPKMAKAFQRKGACALLLADETKNKRWISDAIITLETAYNLDPQAWRTCQNLCNAYIKKFKISDNFKDIEKAIAYGEKAQDLFGNNVVDCRVSFVLGDAYFNAKIYDKALNAYNTTIANCLNDEFNLYQQSYEGIAKSNYWLNRYEDCLQALGWFKDKKHHFSNINYYYGATYFFTEKYELAIEKLMTYQTEVGEYAEANYYIGRSYHILKKFNLAKKYLQKAIDQESINKVSAAEILRTLQ